MESHGTWSRESKVVTGVGPGEGGRRRADKTVSGVTVEVKTIFKNNFRNNFRQKKEF